MLDLLKRSTYVQMNGEQTGVRKTIVDLGRKGLDINDTYS